MSKPLKVKADMKITIPESIILASNLNIKKPIFLYRNEGLFFSNKKYKSLKCYGEIKLDSTYSFIASENIARLFGNIGDRIYLHYYTKKGILYIDYTNAGSNYFYKMAPTDYQVQVPSELVMVKAINFKKPVYLYCYRKNHFGYNKTFYLSNEPFYNKTHLCLGKINLDFENYFTFPATAYYFQDIRGDSICISTDKTDMPLVYKLLGYKRILLKN